MKKKLLAVLFSVIFCMPTVTFASENDIKVYFSSEVATEFENAPYEKDGIIYLPLRELCDKVGYGISYTEPYCYVYVKKTNFENTVKLSTFDCKYEGVDVDFDIKHYPEIVDDRMYIPSDLLIRISISSSMLENGRGLLINQTLGEKEELNLNYDFETNILNSLPKEENSAISPESLKTVLAMTANGVEGETQKQLINALNIEDLEEYNTQQKKKALLRSQSPFTSVSYKMANSIWVKGEENILKDDYKELISDKYSGLISSVGESPDDINNWVKENTDGKIEKVIDNTDFEIMLLNTADFNGVWKYSFDERSTKSGIFKNANGTRTTVDYMKKLFEDNEDFKYYEEDGLKAIALQYGVYSEYRNVRSEDTPYEMVFVLTDKELDSDTLNRIFNNGRNANVSVQLPKFYIENEIDAVDILKNMGVTDMFNPQTADFSPMVEGSGYYVGNVMQNAVLGIDEKGTVASSASEVIVYRSSDERNLEFIADRPFYYFIRNSETGDILFEGMVNTLK